MEPTVPHAHAAGVTAPSIKTPELLDVQGAFFEGNVVTGEHQHDRSDDLAINEVVTVEPGRHVRIHNNKIQYPH